MALYTLSLDTISEVDDGRVSGAFNKMLQEIVEDCNNRAGDASERTLTLKVICKPEMDPVVGGCDSVLTRFELSNKIPKRQSRTISMGRQQNNKLRFNDLAPDDSRQGTIDQAIEQNAAERQAAEADPDDDDEDGDGEE